MGNQEVMPQEFVPVDPVAIVGYSYRMPGQVQSDADFWHLLSQREVVQEPIVERFGRGYRPIGSFGVPHRFASPYEGLIPDEVGWRFDRSFYGISQNEMVQASPALRMLLNCGWEVLEHAGWNLNDLRNSATGVFIGAQTLAEANWRPLHGVNDSTVQGISLAMLANRISYFFNLMGPSITCCTACSAGLTALHTALNALQCGDCEQAIVGAVNYLGSGRLSNAFNALGVISPDGICHSFDAEANGYMRAEGAFTFALKPLAVAERDGDRIIAVIEATSVNSAGAADGTSGLTRGRSIFAPTQHSQVQLMRDACRRAGRDPQEIDYVEAHATGTVVGDRIEGNAIAEAFGLSDRAERLRMASVKSNVGHMEAAAFHCALLKVVLMMQERKFAPISRNFVVPNQEIDFDTYAIRVQTECEPFPARPVVVGINSFGFGGANGHCVVSEYQPVRPRIWTIPVAPAAGYLIPLSARTTGALTKSAQGLQQSLQDQPLDLYTLAANLSCRRTHFPTRTAFAVHTLEELAESLRAFVDDPEPVATVNESEEPLAMVFSGQGTQWAGCGSALYDAHPVFRRVIDTIEEFWVSYADFSLREACLTAPQSELDECRLAQPVIFMLQCALVELLKTWGIYPDCVVGHSSGEVAAAYACGALTLEEATRLVYHRATLQQRTADSGRMLVIGLDRRGVEELLATLQVPVGCDQPSAAKVEIACENSPASTVICGKESVLQPVMEALDDQGFQHQLIPGNIAFHSSAMDPIREDTFLFLAFLDECAFEADVPFISSVTGQREERLDSAYWWRNIRQPVRFGAALETVLTEIRPGTVLEVAPHSALQTTIDQCLQGSNAATHCIPTLMRDMDECRSFHGALGALFRAGVPLDFKSQYPRPRPVSHLLPGYPRDEQQTREPLVDDELFVEHGDFSHGPLVGRRIPCNSLLFEAKISDREFPWLAEHRVYHSGIMPAAGFIELVLEALEGVPVHFEEVQFEQPFPITGNTVRLQTDLQPIPNAPDEFNFFITSRPLDKEAAGELHCQGKVKRLAAEPSVKVPRNLSAMDLSRFDSARVLTGEEFYERTEAILDNTFHYGPNFRTIQQIRMRDEPKEYLVDIEMDEEWWQSGQAEGYVMSPPLFDGGLQMLLVYLVQFPDFFAMPRRAHGVTFFKPPTSPRITLYMPEEPYFWSTLNEYGQRYPVAVQGEISYHDICFYDTDTGDLIVHFGAYCSLNSNVKWAELPNSRHVVAWQPKFLTATEPVLTELPAGEIEPHYLIQALEQTEQSQNRVCRIIELAGSREPDQTVLHRVKEYLTESAVQTEYWLFADNEDSTQAHFEAFNQLETALRFERLDLTDETEPDWTRGLLRPAAAELIFLQADLLSAWPQGWHFLQRLAMPGGLVLVGHEEDSQIAAESGWTTVRVGQCATMVQAPRCLLAEPTGEAESGARWILGEVGGWAAEWASRFPVPNVHFMAGELLDRQKTAVVEEWPNVEDVQTIDFFCDRDPADPTGENVVARLTSFVRALVTFRIGQELPWCRLTVVTQQATFTVEEPRGQTLWGAVRSMAREVGEEANLDFRLVDLGAFEDLEVLENLSCIDFREREVAVRNQQMWVPRINSIRARVAPVQPGADPTYRLRLENAGQVEGLQMKTYLPGELGPKEVEIEVAAAALNFRDIMVTLGMLPTPAFERSAIGEEVGMEASGTVSRIGPEVTQFAPGDEVVFTKGGCIGNRVTIHEFLVFPKPRNLSLVEAASVMSVYVTSYYALIHLARLRSGQRVLIHSAMGGVGHAAIALAKHVGAEIYATAGSEEKREKLRALGVKAAFDSHSFDWYEDLMEATDGEGVDVVLNSLAGHHIALCLQALRQSGWHCEIGKVDIYADNALSLSVFRKNLRFAAIDVDRLMVDDPLLTRQLSLACLELLAKGEVPALPLTVFPFREYGTAMRLMMSGQHQGKLVLEAPQKGEDPGYLIADHQPFLDPEATYLVTGGFRGLGLRLIPYLVVSGARHLTLLDRDPERRRSADWVRRASTLVHLDEECELEIVAGDVSQEADIQRCIGQMQRPLKGVFHLAGVLDDRLVTDMTAESVSEVFAPKAQGALNLHRATLDCPLDHFVMFSSVASTFGNPGQVNYSAASAFLDGLATYRHRQGLPALSFNTAAVKDTGMASRNLHVLRLVAATGLPAVSGEYVIGNLDYALRMMSRQDHLVTTLFQKPPWTADSPEYMRIGHLLNNQDAYQAHTDSEASLDAVVAQIAAKVAELCGHEEGSPEEPLATYGLTSILVAELGAFIQMQFNYQVSALELMTTASCLSLAEAIVSGESEGGKAQTQEDTEDAEDGRAIRRSVHRKPSAFALPLAEHFPADA